MIIVRHDYSIIDKPEMTDNFIIRSDKVKRVWDISEHKIGIQFVTSHDKLTYQIDLEGDNRELLAKQFLVWITQKITSTIEGSVSIK